MPARRYRLLALLAPCLLLAPPAPATQAAGHDLGFCLRNFGLVALQDPAKARDLASWRPQIAAYSQKHYGEPTHVLKPKAIVLHYTAGKEFPKELVETKEAAGEKPGLAVHYVVDGTTIWQQLPDDVRSRGAYGINHRALNIEQVAKDAKDLATRRLTLEATAALTACLGWLHGIPLAKVYAHAEVARMDRHLVPEVLDLVDATPYDKPDPGAANMATIRQLAASFGMR